MMKKPALERLAQRQIQLVMTYAPAGLGHLRVTDALYHALPDIVNPIILGSQDRSIQTFHRITSINPLLRDIFEWFQSGPLSSWSSRVYRAQLRSSAGLVHEQLVNLLDERLEPPEEILVVSTHFGLAHKLAAIKERLQKERQIKVFLAVVVTDATFQHIWYVDGADLIVVPSHSVKAKYAAYGRSLGAAERIEVLPYPLRLDLSTQLAAAELTKKIAQLDPTTQEPIRVSLPVSGAAVGTDYYLQIIEDLRQKSDRFIFHVVSKNAPYTNGFLSKLKDKSGVELDVADADRVVVDAYDDVFQKHIISLEITKPSEQAFKALLGTHSRGGAILLFSEPVGQQESDNLDFLQRHFLIPSEQTNSRLWKMADHAAAVDDASVLFDEARGWRGIRLPRQPQKASNFIWWMLTTGIFSQMMACQATANSKDKYPNELGADGAAEFWNLVESV